MKYLWKCDRCKSAGDIEAENIFDARHFAWDTHNKSSAGCSVMNVDVSPAGDGRDKPEHDPVNAPKHYRSHPSGIEPIVLCEHEDFLTGNALKYLLRHRYKGNPLEDCRKARWYIDRRIEQLEKEAKP